MRLPIGGGLKGIVTPTSDPRPVSRPTALLLNVGLVPHVGPNRLYVRLARQLAAHGIPTLRFDFSGVGDSPSRRDTLHFGESAPLETSKAMDWLGQHLGARRFLLMGICSGARVAFRTACQDDRVAGVAMLNVRSLEEEAYSDLREVASSYGAFHVFRQTSRWKRVLTGQTNYLSALRNLARAALRIGRQRGATQQSANVIDDFRGLVDRGVEVGLFFSSGEFGRKYLRLVLGSEFDSLMSHSRVTESIIPFADHTFTWPRSQDALLESVQRWSASV